MLAELGDSTFALPQGPLTKVTHHTITDQSSTGRGQLAEIRLKGEATEINELEQGSARLAVPVRVPNWSLSAQPSTSPSPTERFTSILRTREDRPVN